jgi:ketosteroid isomerase-like protein
MGSNRGTWIAAIHKGRRSDIVRKALVVVLSLLCWNWTSGRQDFDREAEKAKIAQTVSSVIGWAKTKDLDLFFSVIAHDEDYLSVTPGKSVIKRFEDVKQNIPFWMSPDFKYVRHELKDLEITFAKCGEVAWFYCVLDDINTYKGEPASWENARWTGVVEKRDGRWVVVQQHFSFAAED